MKEKANLGEKPEASGILSRLHDKRDMQVRDNSWRLSANPDSWC